MLPSDVLALGLSPKPAQPRGFLGRPSPPESPAGFFGPFLVQFWTNFW